MLQFLLISHFTISMLNFKPSISPYMYVHRKILTHTAKASFIDKEAQNPAYWPETPFHFSAPHFNAALREPNFCLSRPGQVATHPYFLKLFSSYNMKVDDTEESSPWRMILTCTNQVKENIHNKFVNGVG